MHPDSVVVTQLPVGTRRNDLVDHFSRSQQGAAPIHHLLYPFVNDPTVAVIKYEDSHAMESIVRDQHQINGHPVRIKVLPRQVLSACSADVDPIMMMCIPDIESFTDDMKSRYGVSVKLNRDSGNMTISGSLLQLQCAQTKLNSIYKEQQELQERELFRLGSADTPRLSSPAPSGDYSSQTGEKPSTQTTARSIAHDGNSLPSTGNAALEDFDAFRDITARGIGIRSLDLEDRAPDQALDERLGQSMPAELLVTKEATGNVRKVDELFAGTKSTMKSTLTTTEWQSSKYNKDELSEFPQSLRSNMTDSNQHQGTLDTLGYQGEVPTNADGDKDGLNWTYPGALRHLSSEADGKDNFTSKSMSLAEHAGAKPKTKDTTKYSTTQISTLESTKEDDFVTCEVDALVFRFMTLKHAEKLLQMEKELRVRMQYKREGDITCIRLMSLEDELGVAAKMAKEKLIDLYQTVFYSVLKENLSVEIDSEEKQKHFERIIKQVGVDYKSDIVIERESDSEIVIVGKKFYVSSALEYMKKMLGMTGKSKDVFAKSGRAETARDIVKPKMIFMMQSQPALDTGSEPLTLSSRSEQIHHQDAAQNKTKQSTASPSSKDRPRSGSSEESRLTEVSRFTQGSRTRGSSIRTFQTGTSVWSSGTEKSMSDIVAHKKDVTNTRKLNAEATADMFFDSLEPSSASQAQAAAAAASVLPSVAESTDLFSTQGSSIGTRTRDMMATGGSTRDMLNTFKQEALGASFGTLTKQSDSLMPIGGLGSFQFDTKEGVKVSVYSGDITQENVDVIINPARESLHLLSGVSEALSMAAGPGLQRECTRYIVQHGNLKVTEVCHTGAGGRLRCQHIIHAIAPMWCLYPDKLTCGRDLTATIVNCLNYAETQLKARAIALPAFGSGMYGVPLDVCGRSIFEAICIFSRQSGKRSNLRRVHVVDMDAAVIYLVCEQLLEVDTTSGWGLPTNTMESEAANRTWPSSEDQEVTKEKVTYLDKVSKSLSLFTDDAAEEMMNDQELTDTENISPVKDSHENMQNKNNNAEETQNFGRQINDSSGQMDEAYVLVSPQQKQLPEKEEDYDLGDTERSGKWLEDDTDNQLLEAEGTAEREDQAYISKVREYEKSSSPEAYSDISTSVHELRASIGGRSSHASGSPFRPIDQPGDKEESFKGAKEAFKDPVPSQDSMKNSVLVTDNGYNAEESLRNIKSPKDDVFQDPIENIDADYDPFMDNNIFEETKPKTITSPKPTMSTADFLAKSFGTSPQSDLHTSRSPRTKKSKEGTSVQSPRLDSLAFGSPLDRHSPKQGHKSPRISYDKSPRSSKSSPRVKDSSAKRSSPGASDIRNSGKNVFEDPLNSAQMRESDTPRSSRSFMGSIKSPDIDALSVDGTASKQTFSQPRGGKMMYEMDRKLRLPGYEDTGTIVISYTFPDGEHKGFQYSGTSLIAYLPSIPEGRKVLQMMRKVFDVRKTFVMIVDDSGMGHITLASIEHKTSTDGGPKKNGYPDPDYVERVKNKLEQKGYA